MVSFVFQEEMLSKHGTIWVGFSGNDKAESAEKLTCTDLGLGLQMLGLLHCCDCTGLMLSPQGCHPHPQE